MQLNLILFWHQLSFKKIKNCFIDVVLGLFSADAVFSTGVYHAFKEDTVILEFFHHRGGVGEQDIVISHAMNQ